MKKVLTLCMILGLLIGMAALAAPKAPETTPVPSTFAISSAKTSALDVKAEVESLVAQIRAAKGAGLLPDPALYARLNELQPRPAGTPLDQGADACPATVIPMLPYNDMGSTVGLTDDYTESCVYGMGAPDVIYEYTASADVPVTVSLCGSFFDTGLAVRTDGSCPGAIEIACNDDDCGLQSQVTFAATAGITYYIIVDAYYDYAGDYVLTVTAPMTLPGDLCSNALPLPVPGSVSGSTVGFNNDYDAACPYEGGTSPDVVYTFTPIETEIISLSLCGVGSITDYDSKLYVFENDCGNIIQCNDDACHTDYYASDFVSQIPCFPVTAGYTYYVVVDGYGAGSYGNYTLEASLCEPCPPPPNDNCENVMPVPLPATFTGDNSCATPDCPSFPSQGNAWIAFDVPPECVVVLDYCGTAPAFGNAWLNLAIGCPCESFTSAGAYDVTTCGDGNVTIRWTGLPPGIYYYPVLRQDGVASGPYTINVHCETPAPCADFVMTAPGTLSGNTTDAGDDCLLRAGADQNVEVVIPYTGQWSFSLCPGFGWDTYMFLSGTCCGAEITHNDDYCGLTSEIHCFQIDAGTYYVDIEGYGSLNYGEWTLNVTACTPPPCVPTPVLFLASDPIPQSVCATVCTEQGTGIRICGDAPFDPTQYPIVTVVSGCNLATSNCNEDCTPGQFTYDPAGWMLDAEGCWIIPVFGLSDGCVCVSFEGFLPVELSSFTAIPRDGAVNLAWTTASEADNLRFDIVRNDETVARVEASRNATGASYSWTDRNVTNGTTYTYTLVGVDLSGQRTNLATQSATPSFNSAVITEYALHQNYPNPFNPETQITYDLVDNGLVSLRVYNLMGQEVAVLVNGVKDAGRHTLTFDASRLPSGIYIYALETNGFTAQKKMLLVK